MMPGYHIRPATAADVPAVAKLYDEIHTAEEAGEQTIGWIRGVDLVLLEKHLS